MNKMISKMLVLTISMASIQSFGVENSEGLVPTITYFEDLRTSNTPSVYGKDLEDNQLYKAILKCERASYSSPWGLFSKPIKGNEKKLSQFEFENASNSLSNTLDLYSEVKLATGKARHLGITSIASLVTLGMFKWLKPLQELVKPVMLSDLGVKMSPIAPAYPLAATSAAYLGYELNKSLEEVKREARNYTDLDRVMLTSIAANNCDIPKLIEAIHVLKSAYLSEVKTDLLYTLKNRLTFGYSIMNSFEKIFDAEKVEFTLTNLKRNFLVSPRTVCQREDGQLLIFLGSKYSSHGTTFLEGNITFFEVSEEMPYRMFDQLKIRADGINRLVTPQTSYITKVKSAEVYEVRFDTLFPKNPNFTCFEKQ